jgi:hypothetical protein
MSSALFALAILVAAGQPASQFAGTWTAAFKGDTFARLELREADGALAGRISLGAMHVDKNGVVDEVLNPANNFTPIFDVSFRDGVLSFARKDGDDTDRFELRLSGDALMLRFIFTPELAAEFARDGLPTPVPVRLTRTAR